MKGAFNRFTCFINSLHRALRLMFMIEKNLLIIATASSEGFHVICSVNLSMFVGLTKLGSPKEKLLNHRRFQIRVSCNHTMHLRPGE